MFSTCVASAPNTVAEAAVCQHGVNAYAEAEAVEHGHYGQHLVAGAEEAVGGDYLGRQSVKVEV